MKKTLLLAAATAALTTAATAATQVVSGGSVGAVFAPTDVNGTFNVPQFNIPGETLIGVSLKITGDARSTVTNTGAQTDIFGGTVLVNFIISGFGGGPFTEGTTVTIPNVSLVATATSPVASNSAFATTSVTGSLAAWVGGGTFPVSLQATVPPGGASISGGGGNLQLATEAQGTLEVTYTYQPTSVPEPSFYGAMGALVCFGLLGYRQYRAKQNA